MLLGAITGTVQMDPGAAYMHSNIWVRCMLQSVIWGQEQNAPDQGCKEVVGGSCSCAPIPATSTKNQSAELHTDFLVLFVIQVGRKSSDLIANHPHITATGGCAQPSTYQALNDDVIDHTSKRMTFDVPAEILAIKTCWQVVQSQSLFPSLFFYPKIQPLFQSNQIYPLQGTGRKSIVGMCPCWWK